MIKAVTILLILTLASCTPPTDVDAERTRTNVKNPDPDALLLVSDIINIDFGELYFAETKSRKVKLTNISGEKYRIEAIEFEKQPSVFFVDNSNFPLTLEPNQSLDLFVNARQTFAGEFEDVLIIDGERAPQIELSSVLPDFQLDYDDLWTFERHDVGVRLVTAINNSVLPISINRIYFSGNNQNRFELDFDPKNYLEILPNETFQLPIKFDAQSTGNFNVKLSFEVMNQSESTIVTADLEALVNLQ